MSNSRTARVPVALAAFAVALVAISAIACSSTKSPEDILADAQDAMARVQTFRFEGDLTITDAQGTTNAVHSGGWKSPDRYHLEVESDGHVNELIIAGLRAYAFDSDYLERGWQQQPLLGLGVTSPDFDYVSQLEDPELVADNATVGDVPAYHVRGSLLQEEERARQAEASLDEEDPFLQEKLVSIARWSTGYDIFVSKEDDLVLRVVHNLYMEGWDPSTDAEGVKTFRTIPISKRIATDYLDFNAPMTIEVP